MDIKAIPLQTPAGCNLILGQAHFIKTVEDLHEILAGLSGVARFGLAFSEASGPCLVRTSGNDAELQQVAVENVLAIAAGHCFVILLRDAYPIHFLNAIKQCQEVCTIFCATANPVQVIAAESDTRCPNGWEQGRGILGVVDGFSPKGVESESDIEARRTLLRRFGYKL